MNNTLPDIPRLYTALAEWLACMVYVIPLPKRFHGWRFVAVSGSLFGAIVGFMTLTGDLPLKFWLPCMAGAVGLMFLLIWLCGKISFRDAAFYCVQAFVLAEFVASLEWQLHCFLLLDAPAWQEIGLLMAVYLPVFLLMWAMLRRLCARGGSLDVTGRELSTAAIIGIAVFAASNLSFLTNNTPFSGRYGAEIYNIRTIMDLGGLAILYAHHIQCRELRISRELEAVRNVQKVQYQQYQISKDSIDLINRKYHDMKHQIALLRSLTDESKREQYLDQMEAEIRTYEAQYKTGNQVLDTVLTGKGMYCMQNNISLTCVADGRLLDFMEVMDLSAIFGNALDNAIECVQKIRNPEKRLIHVTVSAQRNFVLIRFENYYEGNLHFSEGLPITTKKDENFHGYGLKSIRYVAGKYGGIATVRTEKQWFVLQILIPDSGAKESPC